MYIFLMLIINKIGFNSQFLFSCFNIQSNLQINETNRNVILLIAVTLLTNILKQILREL